MKKNFRERVAMYDRHRPIIKWYEYDARKLYQNVESEDVTQDETTVDSAPEPVREVPDEEAGTQAASATGDPSLDDEVARIMASFSEAKQNSVDDVFAMMAASGATEDGAGADDEDELISSILKPKQNTVDDLVNLAREGDK